MIKWIALAVGLLIASIFVIRLFKTMLKIEKDNNKKDKTSKEVAQNTTPVENEEYRPEKSSINLNSSNNTIMTDMSIDGNIKDDGKDYYKPSGFADSVDNEFKDYSNHARNRKGRRRKPVDFDLDGEFADDFEDNSTYIPASSEFGYLNGGKSKRQPLKKELQNMPTELKVLMLSDIFDRKFFD